MTVSLRAWAFMIGAVAAILLPAGHALADQIADGEKLFKRCSACHTLEEGKNKIGPSLAGIVGRPAGSAVGYKYSALMKKAGSNALVWDEARITDYLVDATKYLRGYLTEKGAGFGKNERSKMPFRMPKEEQRAAVAAFLASRAK